MGAHPDAPCPWDEDPEGMPIPGAISGIYQVAGSVAIGTISSDIDVTQEIFGNITGASVYSSDILGRGGIQFAASTGVAGSTISGEQAVMMGGGYASGQSTAYLWQLTRAPEHNDEGEENETLVPYCEEAISISRFDLTKGQSGISSAISTPAPSAILSQDFALVGNGSARSTVGYSDMEGFGRPARIDRFHGESRMIGKGLEFASQFNFSAYRGGE